MLNLCSAIPRDVIIACFIFSVDFNNIYFQFFCLFVQLADLDPVFLDVLQRQTGRLASGSRDHHKDLQIGSGNCRDMRTVHILLKDYLNIK